MKFEIILEQWYFESKRKTPDIPIEDIPSLVKEWLQQKLDKNGDKLVDTVENAVLLRLLEELQDENRRV